MDFIPAEPVVDLPAETPAPAPGATAAPETEVVETPETPPEEKTLTQTEVNKIIQKEKAKEYRRAERLAEAKIRAEYAERQLAELKAPPPAQPTGEPKPTQFQDYESYIAALTDFKVNERLSGFQKETRAQEQARAQREQAATLQQKFSATAKKYDDFQEVALSQDVPISEPMAAAIKDSGIGGELAYYLGSNIDEAERIASLSPIGQVREMMKLETKLSAPPAPTKTPPPIVPNAGKSPVAKDPFDFDASDPVAFKKFMADRNKTLGRRR